MAAIRHAGLAADVSSGPCPRAEVGFEGEDLLSRGQLDHGPAGSVVYPLVGEDTVPLDTERDDDLADVLVVERAVADQRLASLPGVAMVTSYVTMKTLSADT